jgi:hypothetical protein
MQTGYHSSKKRTITSLPWNTTTVDDQGLLDPARRVTQLGEERCGERLVGKEETASVAICLGSSPVLLRKQTLRC